MKFNQFGDPVAETLVEEFAIIVNTKVMEAFQSEKDSFTLTWTDLAKMRSPQYNFPEQGLEIWDYVEQHKELHNVFTEVAESYKALYEIIKTAKEGRFYKFALA